MDRQQIGLKLTLDALGRRLQLNDFSNRLKLQKTIYLAQAAGVQLGYQFGWYLRGPYSPGLTRDAFAIDAELNQGVDDARGWVLDPTSRQHLDRLRELFRDVPEEQLSSKLELLASVHFLQQTPAGQGKDCSQLREVLLRNSKNYSETDIRQAVEELTRHGLCPAGGPR
jgi:uncharacterized protein YwgA